MPRRARLNGGNLVMSSPSKRISPLDGGSNPDTQLNIVVLPAPLGPISPVIVPAAAVIATSCSATLPPKRIVTPLMSSRASITRAPPEW